MTEPTKVARFQAGLTAVAGVCALYLAIIAGRPASSFLVAALLVVGVPICLWALVKRSTNPIYRAHRLRIMLVGGALMPLTGLALLAVPASRNLLLHDLAGAPEPDRLAGQQLSVLTSEKHYRIRIAVRADAPRDQVIRSLEVSWLLAGDRACGVNDDEVFFVQDEIQVSPETVDHQGFEFVGGAASSLEAQVVSDSDGTSDTYLLPLRGTIETTCSTAYVSMHLEPTIIVPTGSVVTFAVDIPEYLQMVNSKNGRSLPKTAYVPDPSSAVVIEVRAETGDPDTEPLIFCKDARTDSTECGEGTFVRSR